MAILNDQEILDGTRQTSTNGYTQLKFTTPGKNGRTITSENIPQSQMKASVLIDWCDIIRTQMEVDEEAERDAMEAKRQARIQAEDEKAKLMSQELVEGATATAHIMDEPTVSDDTKLIVPSAVGVPEAAGQPTRVTLLWEQYGHALGEVKRLEAQLRALGESV
jgi:hypothetical protein